MRSTLQRLVLLGMGVALGACAARPAPPVQRYVLGMSRAEYRDYRETKASPCDAEPRWLADELTTVNGLLSRFLRETEQLPAVDAPEHASRLALLQEATRTLPPLLEVHRGTLRSLEECGFRRSGAFPEISQRGVELVEATRARLAQAPAALEAAALHEARRQWKEEAPNREASARGTWCPAAPKVGQPDVYYARQEADGRIEWRFCDGHRVERAAGGEPQLIEPEGLTRRERRLIQPRRYLEAAGNFPTEEVDRQPDTAPARGSAAKESPSGGPG
ncbi:hypothetical protein [Pyxidicoccus trucidator]|uniref:hypothetical protein n=1 Tax=Pyxidicoccus trucidator TaxID=2709662 RepID=UPI001F07DC49|nr:hypothetical protein [Pyxidicoccus trucidator]